MMNYKTLARVAIAFTLVAAIATSLWFASPTKALDITFPSLPASGTLGSTYSFTVKVDISDAELVPIQSVDLTIYNSANSTYAANCTNLPLTNGGSKDYSDTDTGGGTVSVTATAPNWEWFQGYGYALWKGTGYYFGDNIYGYGYQTGAASITYDVSWTTPSGWPTGSYKIEARITANGRTFTQPSNEFTLSTAAPPPPAGGGGGPVAKPGVTNVSAYVTTAGTFRQDVTAKSADGMVELVINKGTTGITRTGRRLSNISILVIEEPPAPPADSIAIGSTYDLGPDGATFDPAITLIITYDPDEIPEGYSEENLAIARWDDETSEWVKLEGCTVDPASHTVTASINYFSNYTILAYPSPAAFTTSVLTISPTEVNIGESVTITVFVTNTGSLEGSYTVTLKIDNMVVATKSVTLAGGANQPVTFTTAKDAAGTYTVNVDGQSGTFTVKPAPPEPIPATFTTSALSISPTEVNIGESVTIRVSVANTGDLTSSYEVILEVDNVVVATEDVTLAGDTSQTVTFTTAKDAAGTYAVNVDGQSGTFTVKEVPAIPPKPTNWWLIGGIIAGFVAISVITTLIVIQRRLEYR